MSRIGNKIIVLPPQVTINFNAASVEIKGPKGVLTVNIPDGITLRQDSLNILVERSSDDFAAVHGLVRSLVANAVDGVSKGFTQQMDIVGVGYKAELNGSQIIFNLGYSHPVVFSLPDGVSCAIEKRPSQIPQYQLTLTLTGIDRCLLGQVAANLHRLRKLDVYKGKGIRYADRILRLKPGKSGGKGSKK